VDELTTCAPAVQAALLRVLAEKVVGDLPLPEDTWFLGACNPPEQAANGIELEAAMANRMYHHKWKVDTEAVLEGYTNGLKFPEPSFPTLPDTWRDNIPGMGGMVAAFHRKNPGRLCMFPEDRSQQGGPWPSPRTWEYGIRCLAAAKSVKGGKSISLTLLSGLIGEPVALEFFQWLENLDLPDPEELLTEAQAATLGNRAMAYDHPDRPDKVMAMLAGINQAVLTNNTAARWEAGMLVMYEASKREMDVALAGAKPLASSIPQGARPSAEFVKELFPRITRALED